MVTTPYSTITSTSSWIRQLRADQGLGLGPDLGVVTDQGKQQLAPAHHTDRPTAAIGRGEPLQPRVGGGPRGTRRGSSRTGGAAAARRQVRELAGRQECYPGVPMEHNVVHGGTRESLFEASRAGPGLIGAQR